MERILPVCELLRPGPELATASPPLSRPSDRGAGWAQPPSPPRSQLKRRLLGAPGLPSVPPPCG